MNDSEYQKVPKGHWLFQDLKELQSSYAWVCDAVDHNAPEGCSNPKCFKFKSLLKISDECVPYRHLMIEADPTPKPRLYEAWFKCGCTKIAPRHDITEYCSVHGDDREGLVIYEPLNPVHKG